MKGTEDKNARNIACTYLEGAQGIETFFKILTIAAPHLLDHPDLEIKDLCKKLGAQEIEKNLYQFSKTNDQIAITDHYWYTIKEQK